MRDLSTPFGKITFALGVLSLISGIYFLIQGNFTEGISAVGIGALLLFLNKMKPDDADKTDKTA